MFGIAFYCLLASALCLPLFPGTAAAESVEKVVVSVEDVSGRTSDVLLERMTASMQVVAEQLFLDREAATIAKARQDYERLLGEVGERALTGYKVESIDILVGRTAKVSLKLSPWLDAVGSVRVDLNFSGVDKQTAADLSAKLPGLEEKIRHTLQGASLDSVDWAGGVLRQKIRQEVERNLPEFRASVDLSQTGKTVVAQVIVYPVGEIVQQVKFELFSETVPNILLLQAKKRLRADAETLRGLPVEYLRHHRGELEQKLLEAAFEEKVVGIYDLQPVVTIAPAVDAEVFFRMNAAKYKIWFEGYADLGREEDNLSGRAHVGKYFSDRDEVFAEVSLELEDMDWEFAPGYAHKSGKTTFAYLRRLSDHENNYRLEYELSPKWRLRAEHFSDSDRNEFGARYRIHEFLSVEYVYSTDKPYLRLVGNL